MPGGGPVGPCPGRGRWALHFSAARSLFPSARASRPGDAWPRTSRSRRSTRSPTGHSPGIRPRSACCRRARDPGWMQLVAREMNLAETAFLVRRTDGYDLRWFTPSCEVDLCGHATLASAHVLWEEGHFPADTPVRFHTRSGVLTAGAATGSSGSTFPPRRPYRRRAVRARATPSARRSGPSGRRRSTISSSWSRRPRCVAWSPTSSGIGRLPVRGVIVTAASAERSRTSSPGSSRRPRACRRIRSPARPTARWRRSGPRDWASELSGYQASARGGRFGVRLAGDRVAPRRARAITVLRGECCCQ